MIERSISLVLTRAQCLQWHAHMLTYVYSYVLQPHVPKDQARMETLTALNSRFFASGMQEGPTMRLLLNAEEVQAVKHMLSTLEQLYEREPRAPHALMALEHLAACRVQLRQAEQARDASEN